MENRARTIPGVRKGLFMTNIGSDLGSCLFDAYYDETLVLRHNLLVFRDELVVLNLVPAVRYQVILQNQFYPIFSTSFSNGDTCFKTIIHLPYASLCQIMVYRA